MKKSELSKKMVNYVNQFKEGICLYEFAEAFIDLPEEDYREALTSAVKSRKIKERQFTLYPK